MYERFTDRARKVMQLANQEAQRLNHEYIGAEHILLGLAKEATGVGSNVLRNLDIDLGKIRLEVEKIVQPGPDELVTMGKLPQTPRAKKVIELSIQAAIELNHNYVGSEHLLLGLITEGEGVPAQVLKELGLTREKVIDGIRNVLGHNVADDPLSQFVAEFVAAAKANPSIATDPVAMLGWFARARMAMAGQVIAIWATHITTRERPTDILVRMLDERFMAIEKRLAALEPIPVVVEKPKS